MKIYFLAIPIIIGIVIGIGLTLNLESTPNDSSILNKENLMQGSAILGNPDAEITIVEFGDYQCTFCYKFHDETMKKIDQAYIKAENVNFVYRDFPLNGHNQFWLLRHHIAPKNKTSFGNITIRCITIGAGKIQDGLQRMFYLDLPTISN